MADGVLVVTGQECLQARKPTADQWRLRETMAAHGMFTATDLAQPLADRGITLSSVQTWRLVTHTPERLSLPILAALCDIFDCTPADLIATKAENATPHRTATGETGGTSAQIAPIRPKRARIRPDQ